MIRRPPRSTLFPYTTALPIWPTYSVTSHLRFFDQTAPPTVRRNSACGSEADTTRTLRDVRPWTRSGLRSEEHTSELQSHLNLVCRLLLEKKKTQERISRSCII